MSQELKERYVRYIISRLIEIATHGGLKLLALDLQTGRALFKIDPNNQHVEELVKLVPIAPAA